MIYLIASASIGGITIGAFVYMAMEEKLSGARRWADRNQRAFLTANGKLSAIRDLLDTPRAIRKKDVRDVLDGVLYNQFGGVE